jgi:hypothetical protein
MVTPRRVVFCFDERSLEPVAKLAEQGRMAIEGCACPVCAWAKGRSLARARPVSFVNDTEHPSERLFSW